MVFNYFFNFNSFSSKSFWIDNLFWLESLESNLENWRYSTPSLKLGTSSLQRAHHLMPMLQSHELWAWSPNCPCKTKALGLLIPIWKLIEVKITSWDALIYLFPHDIIYCNWCMSHNECKKDPMDRLTWWMSKFYWCRLRWEGQISTKEVKYCSSRLIFSKDLGNCEVLQYLKIFDWTFHLEGEIRTRMPTHLTISCYFILLLLDFFFGSRVLFMKVNIFVVSYVLIARSIWVEFSLQIENVKILWCLLSTDTLWSCNVWG